MIDGTQHVKTVETTVWNERFDMMTSEGRIYAIVSDLVDGVNIIDVTTPENSFVVSQISLSSVYDLRISSFHEYHLFVVEKYLGLTVVDVSDVYSPIVIGSLTLGVETHPTYLTFGFTGLTTDGNYAFICDRKGSVVIIDISDPYNPFKIGEVEVQTPPEKVEKVGEYLYVVSSSPEPGLSIIDVKDPSDPILISEVSTTSDCFSLDYYPSSSSTTEDLIYLSCDSGGIKLVGTNFSVSEFYVSPSGSSTNDVFCDLYRCYVGDGDVLRVLDITDTNNILELETINDLSNTRMVYVQNNVIYVGDGVGGFKIFTTSGELTIEGIPSQNELYQRFEIFGTVVSGSSEDISEFIISINVTLPDYWVCFDIPSNYTNEVCKSHGECVHNDECFCHANFSGDECEVCERSYCSENGDCSFIGTEDPICDCDEGFTGQICNETIEEEIVIDDDDDINTSEEEIVFFSVTGAVVLIGLCCCCCCCFFPIQFCFIIPCGFLGFIPCGLVGFLGIVLFQFVCFSFVVISIGILLVGITFSCVGISLLVLVCFAMTFFLVLPIFVAFSIIMVVVCSSMCPFLVICICMLICCGSCCLCARKVMLGLFTSSTKQNKNKRSERQARPPIEEEIMGRAKEGRTAKAVEGDLGNRHRAFEVIRIELEKEKDGYDKTISELEEKLTLGDKRLEKSLRHQNFLESVRKKELDDLFKGTERVSRSLKLALSQSENEKRKNIGKLEETIIDMKEEHESVVSKLSQIQEKIHSKHKKKLKKWKKNESKHRMKIKSLEKENEEWKEREGEISVQLDDIKLKISTTKIDFKKLKNEHDSISQVPTQQLCSDLSGGLKYTESLYAPF